MDADQVKLSWEGAVVSVQPRSTVWRYWVDNRTHREIGYNVFIQGAVLFDDSVVKDFGRGFPRYDFCVAVSEKQQEKLVLRIGDVVRALVGRRNTLMRSLPTCIAPAPLGSSSAPTMRANLRSSSPMSSLAATARLFRAFFLAITPVRRGPCRRRP